MVRAMDPHKTSQSPEGQEDDELGDAPEWRGGNRPEQERQQRSGERGWGVANAGGQRQHGDGGQRGGDLDNQGVGGRDEKGDARREHQTDKSEAGQGSSNR
jgi:hypothetical protein